MLTFGPQPQVKEREERQHHSNCGAERPGDEEGRGEHNWLGSFPLLSQLWLISQKNDLFPGPQPTTYTFLEPGCRAGPQYRGGGPGGQGRGGPGYPPQFLVQLRLGLREFLGEGPTAQVGFSSCCPCPSNPFLILLLVLLLLQAAKHSAASKALKALRDVPVGEGKSKLDPTSLPFIPGERPQSHSPHSRRL